MVLFSRRDVPLAAKELKSTDCGEIAKVFKTSFKIPSAWFALGTQEEVQKQELLFHLENGLDARIRSGASTGASPEGGGVLDLSLGRGCRPDLETLTLFMTKKIVKILKN